MTVLLFLATIVLFLTVDYFVQRSKKEALQPVRKPVPAFRFPDGIFFSKNHTWMNLFPSGKVQLGIDDFLMRMFEAPAITYLKKDGDAIRKGEPILRMFENEKELIVRSPIEGKIEMRNTELAKRPLTSETALFSEGWAYTIKPAQPKEIRNFLMADETKYWVKRELGRLRDFLAVTAPQGTPAMVILQDGGEPMPGVLTTLTADTVKKFEQQFLNEF
ncbi:MAG: hypothetical protein H3C35_10725 [Bacteroidetes bacterium]|nr:hypothetical protein [Bacteroidota bacterium]